MHHDVVTQNILRAKFDALVAGMATALINTSRCTQISTARRFACGLLDRDRSVVAVDNPMYLTTLGATARKCLNYYEFATAGDDVIACNDPFSGGSTVHHFTVVAPVAFEQELVAYAVVQAHMGDIGGVVMGNYYPGATELWAEGACFTPIKIVVDGKVRRDVLDTVVLNSREPEVFRADMEAMIATARNGGQRLLDLVKRHGLAGLEDGMAGSLDYSERRFRAHLQQIPTGIHTGEAVLDHDACGGRDIHIRAELSSREGGITLDFRASDDQGVGFVNSTVENTQAYALVPLLSLLDEPVPWNDGLLRAVQFRTRTGSVVNAKSPAPTGWSRDHSAYEVCESVAQALAAAIPERCGVGYANRSLVTAVDYQTRIGDVEEQLGVIDLAAFTFTGAAARPSGDGWGQPGPSARGQLPSVEEFESAASVRIERLEYAEDSGGPGRWRGGVSTTTTIRFPADSGQRLFISVAGRRNPSPGYLGGGTGGGTQVWLSTDASREVEELLQGERVTMGATLTVIAAGGGGFGASDQRPPDLVLADVVSGVVSREAARSEYRVVVATDGMVIDEEATRRLRSGSSAETALGSASSSS